MRTQHTEWIGNDIINVASLFAAGAGLVKASKSIASLISQVADDFAKKLAKWSLPPGFFWKPSPTGLGLGSTQLPPTLTRGVVLTKPVNVGAGARLQVVSTGQPTAQLNQAVQAFMNQGDQLPTARVQTIGDVLVDNEVVPALGRDLNFYALEGGQLIALEEEASQAVAGASKLIRPIAYITAAGAVVKVLTDQTGCTVCKTRTQNNAALCKSLTDLQQRGGPLNGPEGVKKLCASTLNNSQLKAVADRVLSFADAEVSAFLADVNKIFGAAGLDGNLNKLSDLNYIDAWKVVYDARCAGVANCNENTKADWAVLTQVKSMLQDNAVLTALGNRAGLVEILQKNERTPCNTCGSGGASYLNKMDVYLKDVEYFVENYQGIGGWNTVVGSQGIKNGGIHQVEATAFMLRALHENPVEFESQVSGFEVLTGVGKRKMDIQKHSGTNVECKSWDDNADTFADFVAGSSNSYQQFLAYLQVVPDLTKLEYWLDGRKLTGATNADKLMTAKLKFRTLFQNKAEYIYKAKPSIFNAYKLPDGSNISKWEDLQAYAQLDLFLTSNILSFIKVK